MADAVMNDLARWGKYEPAIRRWEGILGRPMPEPQDREGRLNPAMVEHMMGYPEGWVAGLSRAAQLRCLGNAMVPLQAAVAWAHLLGFDVSTEAGGASEIASDSEDIRRQRSRDPRRRRPGSPDGGDMPLIPTPTAWLGLRPSHGDGDAARWTNPERSRELSDFVAWLAL